MFIILYLVFNKLQLLCSYTYPLGSVLRFLDFADTMSTGIWETNPNALSLKHKLRALVVNDSKLEQVLLVAILTRLGVETLVADNEKEALEVIQGGAILDLIVMDREMHELDDGIHATRKLRAMGVTAKIIGISNEDMREVELEFLNAGADEFVPKPIKREKLMSILEEIDNEI
ncbi:putative histidine kinase response regulator and transcription factor RR-A-type family [Dioscorea sansibarensis]